MPLHPKRGRMTRPPMTLRLVADAAEQHRPSPQALGIGESRLNLAQGQRVPPEREAAARSPTGRSGRSCSNSGHDLLFQIPSGGVWWVCPGRLGPATKTSDTATDKLRGIPEIAYVWPWFPSLPL